MVERGARRRRLCVAGLIAALAVGRAAAEEPNVRSIAAGWAYDHFARSVVWTGEGAASKMRAHCFAARAEIGLASGLVFSLSAGLALTDLPGLTFGALPVSLRFSGAALKGFALAAEASVPVRRFGGFEIAAAGRIVYAFGVARSWTLEGFAVEGRATAQPSWIEVEAGPRVSYVALDRVAPFLEVRARMLWAGQRMTETLGDLAGEETKKVRGDLALAFAVGADVRATGRLGIRVKAGIMPAAAGVDGLVSAGVLYGF